MQLPALALALALTLTLTLIWVEPGAAPRVHDAHDYSESEQASRIVTQHAL